MSEPTPAPAVPRGAVTRFLDAVERIGNKLPDPAVLFLILMLATWVLSALLANVSFAELDPRTGDPISINNLLAGTSFTAFMAEMVRTFVNFAPLGVVLVAMLGLGVAEHTGFINAALRAVLSVTPKALLTPVLVGVGILSHVAVDAGYVLVIPLGAVIFYAAGRHPLAGIAAAFAGVSGGFSATFFVPSSLDPLLAGLTQEAAHILDPSVVVNPLNNYFFTTASTFLIIAVGWFLTDRVIEPRLRGTVVDGDTAQMPTMDALGPRERRGLWLAVLGVVVLAVGLLVLQAMAGDDGGELATDTTTTEVPATPDATEDETATTDAPATTAEPTTTEVPTTRERAAAVDDVEEEGDEDDEEPASSATSGGPGEAAVTYVRTLDRDDLDGAWAMTTSRFQAQQDRRQWERFWRDHDVEIVGDPRVDGGTVIVPLTYDGQREDYRLDLVQQGGRWLVDGPVGR